MTALIGILNILSQTIVGGSYAALEEQSVRRDLSRAVNTLAADLDGLNSKASDWATWDAAYEFVQGENPEFAKTDVTVLALQNLDIDLMLFLQPDGTLVLGRAVDLAQGVEIPLPQGVEDFLADRKTLNAILQNTKPDSRLTGILLIRENPMMIAARPIVTSVGKGPVRGTLIFGHYLDRHEAGEMSETIQLSLAYQRIDQSPLPDDFQIAANNLSEANPLFVRNANEGVVNGYASINDVFGKPAVILRVDETRDIYKQGQSAIRYFTLASIGIGILFTGITHLVLNRLVRSQRELRESEERYRAVIEQASEGIFLYDAASGRVVETNAAFRRLLGNDAPEARALTFYDVFDAERQTLTDMHARIVRERIAEMGEQRMRRRDGATLHVEASASVITYGSREVICAVMRDITERKRAQDALERLYEQEQSRRQELDALFIVSSALREARTLSEMLPIILRATLQVMECDQGIISLVDRERDEVVVRAATPGQESLMGTRTKIGQGIAGRVLHTGSPMLPADFAGLQAPEAVRRVAGEPRAVVCYPLKTSAGAVGVVYLSAPLAREFSEGDLKLLGAIADMAANAIHRASLFEQVERRAHELSTLFDVSKVVTASLRIDEVLKFVATVATQAVHAEGSYLFLWDERVQRLVLRVSSGFLEDEVGRLQYRSGEGLSGWVFLEGRAINAPDLASDPRWKRDPGIEAPLTAGQANNALVVPLVAGKKGLGVLGVVNKIGAPAPSTEFTVSKAELLRASFTAGDESLLITLAGQIAIAIENARLYEDVRGLSVAAIRSLATAIDARDPYTHGHSASVSRLAVQLARDLGWSGADLEMLEFAGLLHDVGKIAVPDAVLRKVEPLTADEWNIIRLHPYHSAQIVKPVESLLRIVPWVYHHQERWDGTGYPDGLKGEAIPLASRIIAVADTFNAMTTDRPYRKALPLAKALAEIEHCAGSQFDPAVAAAFLRMMQR